MKTKHKHADNMLAYAQDAQESTKGNYTAKIKKSTNCYGVYYYTVTVTYNVQGREDFLELKSYQTEKAAIKGANKILASYQQS